MVFGSDFKLEWNELKRFEKLSDIQRSIVFYVEDENYYIYLKSIMNELTKIQKINICYVTSSKSDPLLEIQNEKIKSFYIGNGTVRTKFFLNLKADLLIMTMPDLETFHIKRSKVKSVNYVYVFHSAVSTHLIYRKDAFDNFDTILCVGDYQIKEIQERELKYNLNCKKLIKCGYPRLDELIKEYQTFLELNKNYLVENQILIAPSWGENGLIETKGEEIISKLLDSDYKVILRPHPMTIKKSSKIIQKIKDKFVQNQNFKFEQDIRTFDSFFTSEYVISDWSGVAIEYAFTTKKPVLFIDLPKKMRNQEYEKISFVPLEERIREQIGEILSPNDISQLDGKIHFMKKNQDEYSKIIESIYHEIIFNKGNSAEIAVNEILQLMNEQKKSAK
tara:strand:- start:3700 stop:4872 length:1173 start_codon:yes stop_codon:yes gene_type:complete